MKSRLSMLTDDVRVVFQAMASAHLKYSTPMVDAESCYVQAYLHIRKMRLCDIAEWHEGIMTKGCSVVYHNTEDLHFSLQEPTEGAGKEEGCTYEFHADEIPTCPMCGIRSETPEHLAPKKETHLCPNCGYAFIVEYMEESDEQPEQ